MCGGCLEDSEDNALFRPTGARSGKGAALAVRKPHGASVGPTKGAGFRRGGLPVIIESASATWRSASRQRRNPAFYCVIGSLLVVSSLIGSLPWQRGVVGFASFCPAGLGGVADKPKSQRLPVFT